MRRLVVVCCMVVAVACASCRSGAGTGLEIVRMVAPDLAGCTVSVTGATQANGLYDPTGAQVVETGGQYVLSVALSNHLEPRDASPALGASLENTRPQSNAIEILGFDACWFEPGASYNEIGSHDGGVATPCSSVSNARFITTAGTVETGDTEEIVTIHVLTIEDLQGLWGAAFDPAAIAPIGIVTGLSAEDASYIGSDTGRYYDPGPDTTAAAWGTYPTPGLPVDIVLQLRAVGETQGGLELQSNWFNYKVTICPGCVLDDCGLQPEITCDAEVCANGYPCDAAGTCPIVNPGDAATPCEPSYDLFVGSDLTGVNCLAFSGNGTLTCTARPGC